VPSMRVPSRRVLGRAIKAIQGRTIKVPSRQFRLPFAVGEAITGAYEAGLSERLCQVRSAFVTCSASKSNPPSLVLSRQVRSGIALFQLGLLRRSVGWRRNAGVELSSS